jgi:hypothetical protein
MQNTAYRLADYKVIENNHGDLWWETHIGLGSLKSGKCFINEDILFIEPSDITGPGFLKGEFLDHLNKLPKWERTKYYCASYKIYKCQSASRKPLFEGVKSRLQDEAILRKNELIQKEAPKATRKSIKADTTAPISYKLGRYKITEINNGQLFWKSPGGSGSLEKGRCHIKGSILFLEAGETELSSLLKSEFRQQLNRLADWERTEYFCPSYTIYYSNTGAICRRLGEEKDLNRTGTKYVVVDRKAYDADINIEPVVVNKGDPKEKLKAFLNFCILLMILILRILFKCFQMIFTGIRFLIGKWNRFRD